MKKRIWKRLFIALLCLALIGGVTVSTYGRVEQCATESCPNICGHKKLTQINDILFETIC